MGAMQQYVAANLALAWNCRVEPTGDPSVWLAWRDSGHPVAAIWIDGSATGFEQAEEHAVAALGHRSGPKMITVMAISATSAMWSAGGAPRTMAMPVIPRRRPAEPLWYCETCKCRHPLRLMAACRAGQQV
jgi:hypothetical protein